MKTRQSIPCLVLAAWLLGTAACASAGGDRAEVLETTPDPGLEQAVSGDASDEAPDGSDVDAPPGPDDPPYARWVDPFIGTGGTLANVGSAYPGAVAPFGMVKASPDTHPRYGAPITFQHCAGYWYDDVYLYGITHNHMHGSGGTEYGNLAVFPAGAMTDQLIPKDRHLLPFTHDDELARPGYYAVTVGSPGATTFSPLARHEVTATTRCAHHRIRFLGHGATGTVVLDAAIGLGDNNHSGGGELAIDPAQLTLEGRDFNVNHSYDVYFSGRFDRPFASFGTWLGDAVQDGRAQVQAATDPSLFGAWASFDTSANQVVELQLCISYVSKEGARLALDEEMPQFDFDGTAAATLAAWEHELSAVAIEGGSESAKRNFYTALYHT
jgi:putative alpha-1,2-mannosidase